MKPPHHEVHVWIADPASVPLEVDGRSILSADEVARAESIRVEAAARRFEGGRAWTRTVLAGYLDVRADEIVFAETEDGKPYLRDIPEVHFNASHSGDRAAVAVADVPVGVDVERLRAMRNLEGMIDRNLSAAELDWMSTRSPGDRSSSFFDLWVRKESFLKGVGTGIRSRLSRITAIPGAPGTEEKIAWDLDPDVAPEWRLRAIDVGESYRCCVAYASRGCTLVVRSGPGL